MVTWSKKTFSLKEKISKRTMLYSLIVFAISIIIFNATINDMWLALSGFFMIISGAVIVLFILIYLILKVMEGLNRKKMKTETIKKISKPAKKKISTKKKIVSKKKPAPKKVAKKKATKKKTTSKKRK